MTEAQRQELVRAVRKNLALRGSRASAEQIDAANMMRSAKPRGRRGTGALRGSVK